MGIPLPRCEHCGRTYRPDRFNRHRQKYCTRPECKAARKRQRQRDWHGRKCRDDPEFRKELNRRCAEANRNRRAKVPSASATVPEPPMLSAAQQALQEALYGLICQINDTSDPVQLSTSLSEYRARGRRVTAQVADRGPPV